MKHIRAWLVGSASVFAATAAGAAEDGQIPQMDQTWYPNQLLWLAVSFIVLYTLVSRVIAPRIGQVLEAREKAIANAIREAEIAKRVAESTKGDYESNTSSSRNKAAEMIATVQAQASAEASQALVKLDHELTKKSEQAQARLDEAVSKAQSGMETATINLASAMAEKLLGQAVSSETVSDAVKPLAKAS